VTNNRGFSLMELIITIGLMAVILGFAAGPFLDWYRKGKLEDRASSLHETFKWAQTQAMKRGGADVVNGKIISSRIYIAINQDANSYKIVRWVDTNADNVKTANEIAELQVGSLMEVRFGIVSGVDKTACSNSGVLTGTDPIRNLTFLQCPQVASSTMFADHRCARFDGKGFLTESMENIALYVTNGTNNYGISLNPAGVITFCRWSGTDWQFVR